MARLVEVSDDANTKDTIRVSSGARLVPVDDEPAAVTAGRSLNSSMGAIPRQLGLTARYALEGPAEALQVITEPIRQHVTDPIARFFGGQSGRPLGQEATRLADAIGLPKLPSRTRLHKVAALKGRSTGARGRLWMLLTN